MANILYLMPGAGTAPEERQRRERIANTFLTNPAHKVTVDTVGKGVTSIECSIDGEISIHGMLKKALVEREHFDALIVGCADDPGLFSLRELLDVPVVGPLESSIAFSSMLGDRFTLMTTSEDSVPESRMILRKYGVLDKCASVRYMNFLVLDMMTGKTTREEVLGRFLEEVDLARKDGATSVVMGCMTMAFLLLDEDANRAATVPVINPAKIAVKTAEMMVSLGMRHSDAAYPKPDLERVKQNILMA
jgi:allantoin racemase